MHSSRLVKRERLGYYLAAMDQAAKPSADGTAYSNPGESKSWLVVLLSLMAWQGWMTLELFGPDHPWQHLWDDQPILSGRHPLHFYHGILGAQSFRDHGRLCCYDPAFQAGYPKTPIFDSGSRPAELFLTLAAGENPATAYKVGLAVCCCLVPVLLAIAARSFGLPWGMCCLAAGLGQLVWWGSPGRAVLEAGDLNLLLAALAAVVHVVLLLRFHHAPGFACWLGLLLTGCAGWFTQPLLFALVLPLALIYYLSVGPRHGLGWHFALLGTLAGALASNGFWLLDWASYWWIRLPLFQWDNEVLPDQPLQVLWQSAVWGNWADRGLSIVLMGLAVLGVLILNQTKQRPAARLLGLGAGGFLFLVAAGIVWKPLEQLGADRLLIPSLWFAVLPAVYAIGWAFQRACRLAGNPSRGAVFGFGVIVVGTVAGHRYLTPLATHFARPQPLTVGLSPQRQALIATLRDQTTSEARILWEDRPARYRNTPSTGEPGWAGPPALATGASPAGEWTALLPYLTGRMFLGGLDPDCSIEHSFASLAGQTLAGRPLSDWSDGELEAFCRKYNIGWVVCWSPGAISRFRSWNQAEPTTTLRDGEEGWLFTLRPRSFALKGQARLLSANSREIVLADIVPDDGQLVLSFHYQAGLRAIPDRVQVEREPDPFDPIPFIRLRVPGPLPQVTLTWEDP
jgi:hypothetical protein